MRLILDKLTRAQEQVRYELIAKGAAEEIKIT